MTSGRNYQHGSDEKKSIHIITRILYDNCVKIVISIKEKFAEHLYHDL